MARLYLFAEGLTEQMFAREVLAPHLAEDKYRVYIDKVMLIAHAHKKHRTHRGGGRNFHAMQKDIVRCMKQESGSDVFFTTMIDLYALHKEFPGIEKSERYRSEPYRRVEMLEESWASKTSDSRFIPHIQLHEYETYLFVDLSVLSDYYEGKHREIARLAESVGSFESPELIDDGPDTAPSKRIIHHLPRYASDKSTVGVQAAERIGVSAIREKCPHFSQWLERLEGLATPPAH